MASHRRANLRPMTVLTMVGQRLQRFAVEKLAVVAFVHSFGYCVNSICTKNVALETQRCEGKDGVRIGERADVGYLAAEVLPPTSPEVDKVHSRVHNLYGPCFRKQA